MTSWTAIEGILFDLDGTLTDYKASSETGLMYAYREMEKHGIHLSFGAVAARYRSILDEEIPRTSRTGIQVPSKMHRERRFEILLRSFGIEPDKAVLNRLAHAYGRGRSEGARLFPGVKDTLDALKKKFVLGLVTEGAVRTQTDQIDRLGLRPYFEAVVISGATPFHKPALELFQIALDAMKCRAEHVCMVGDRIDWDLIPASTLGMKTILFRPQGMEPLEYPEKEHVDIIVRSFDELRKHFSKVTGESTLPCR